MNPAVRDPSEAYQTAVSHIRHGRWAEAAALLETWAPRHPLPALWSLLGAARHRLGDLERACEAFATSLDLAPGQPDTLHNLAITLRDLGRPHEAITYCRRALALKADYPAAQRLLAELYHNLGDNEQAEHLLRQLVQRHPDDLAAWNNLGLLLSQSGHHAEAMEAFQRGLERKDDPELFNNLGLAALRAGQWQRARQHLHHALQLAPQDPSIHNNLGLLAERQGDYQSAEHHFRQALHLDPEHGEAHSNLARLLLARGEFRAGWEHYRWRRHRRGRQYLTALPAELAGQTLHIRGEQGLGDELFFLRWAPLLRAEGTRIHYHGDPRLAPILDRSRVIDHFEPRPPAESASYSVADLPWLWRGDETPPPPPLLSDPQQRQRLAEELASLPRPWIGLTWEAGTPGNETLHKRIDPQTLARHLPAGGTLITLQRHGREDDMRALKNACGERPLVDHNALHDDLEALLALLDLLDDYFTVSNTALHLRAGLGKRAQVFIPHPPEWRWMHRGDSSPWFPGMHLQRQNPNGQWELSHPDWK